MISRWDKAALVGCGVTTGWGTAVYAADVSPGDTVVVLGIGGVGANAVQGARIAGATQILAVDPSPFNREQAKRFGATHTVASAEAAHLAVVLDSQHRTGTPGSIDNGVGVDGFEEGRVVDATVARPAADGACGSRASRRSRRRRRCSSSVRARPGR
jgi:Zn-dependent alcohol dehydrogenase